MYKFRTNTSNNSHSKRKQKGKKKKNSKSKIKNEILSKSENTTPETVIPENTISNDKQSYLVTNNPMSYVQTSPNFSHIIYFDAGYYYCNSFLMLNETISRNEKVIYENPVRNVKINKKPKNRPTPTSLTSELNSIKVESNDLLILNETESNILVNIPLSYNNLVDKKTESQTKSISKSLNETNQHISNVFLYKNDLFNDNSLFISCKCLHYFNVKDNTNYEMNTMLLNQITLSKNLIFDSHSFNNDKTNFYFDRSNQSDASSCLLNDFDLFLRYACNTNILKSIRDSKNYNCLENYNLFSNESILTKLLLYLYLNEIIKSKYSFAIQNTQNLQNKWSLSLLAYIKKSVNSDKLINEIKYEKSQMNSSFDVPSFTSNLRPNKRSKSNNYLCREKKVKLNKKFKSSICLFEKQNQIEILDSNSSSTSFSDLISIGKNEQSFELKKDTIENFEIEAISNLSRKVHRPSYIIERDCHVFGGCMDDDALDEFFISSGAVYQSWPYVYEPGFQLVPLFNIVNLRMSRSAIEINSYDQNCNFNSRVKNEYSNNYNESQDELPSYSINNFEINMLHVKKKKKSKKKKHKKTVTCNSIESSSIVENSSSFVSLLSFSNESSFSYTDESSDDSESIIEYKRRHAVGLNFNSNFNKVAKCNSHLNLSNNKNDSGFLNKKAHKENENYRKSSCESLKLCQRLATSAYYNKNPSIKKKKIRFLSQKRIDYSYQDCEYIANNHEPNFVSQNFIF